MSKEEKEVKKPNTIPTDELLTITEVSTLYKMRRLEIEKLIKFGFIRSMKLGRIKMRTTEVNAFTEWAEGKNFDFRNGLTVTDQLTGEVVTRFPEQRKIG